MTLLLEWLLTCILLKDIYFQSRGLKGHEDVIDAIHILKKEFTNIKVVFVGGEWGKNNSYFKRVMDYAEKRIQKNAIFLGNRKDVIDIYPNFDISVCLSHSENVGSAVESLLMSIPTISSNVGGFPDLIKDMSTGLLVEAKNPFELADAIKKYYYDSYLRKEHAKNGKALAEKLFDVNITAKQVLNIYKEIKNA